MTKTIEDRILARIIDDAIAAGLVISLNDGEETTVECSSNPEEITTAAKSTDEDILSFYKMGEFLGKVGWVHLIWGNDQDLISDSSVSHGIDALIDPIMKDINDDKI